MTTWPHSISISTRNPPSRPPVFAIGADIGLGKTRAWRERVAAVLVAAGKHPVLAVPRHRLGDEIVRDLAAAGMTAASIVGARPSTRTRGRT